ncbi:MAG TPA: M15 family metallopeptidase [Flavobacteriaceae bacterium]|nr:M15 family metallopeptidase [Flavobacteriaceae bacterium]MCB9213205.1 M15 family metallopeptidase [Alteromonas sp.]HPF10123.1 M15 family metallopeptidase [Flavobacteriaceae bacterium]HQU22244.1 M15 family metallopeptidase [Flavobacteriaceae bacterium]HQU66125.1 M15 family metallopeptidase [Flavobacteriaceae bacterium]
MGQIPFKNLCLLVLVCCAKGNSQQALVDLASLPSNFTYEIRYATSDNFMGTVLYPCAKCLLRAEVAEALLEANQYFCEKGYQIKIYDCYRPLDIQKAMWSKVPNAAYVANPYDKGSVHNRGAAVDITLVTLEGCEVAMGTDYDYFGKEAHIDNLQLPETILSNRNLLLEGMKQFGFQPIRTEWWHFSFIRNYQFPILNEPLPCD